MQPISIENKSTSDYETSAGETIRLGDIVSSPLIVSDAGNTVNFSFENVINTQVARLKSQQILDDIKGTVLGDAINNEFNFPRGQALQLLNNFDDAVRVPASDMKHGEKAVEIRKQINGIAIVATIEHGKNKQFVVSGWKKMSAASMLRNASPKLNVRSAADIQMIQQEIAGVKRTARDSSKVVDENGEPLVVYRGDNKNHTKYEWAKFIKGQSFSFYCPSTQDS